MNASLCVKLARMYEKTAETLIIGLGRRPNKAQQTVPESNFLPHRLLFDVTVVLLPCF